MALNKDDASKIGYKAQIEWLKERKEALSNNFVNQSVIDTAPPDVEKYRKILADLLKKANKLSDRIDSESAGRRIPVNKVTDPSVYEAVLRLDPSSGGEYISYELYKSLIEQANAGVRNLDVLDIIDNSSSDAQSNSQLVQDRIYAGYAKYAGKDSSGVSKYIDSITSWNDHDYDLRQVVTYSDNYLSGFTDSKDIPWSFKPDIEFDKLQIEGFQGLWNLVGGHFGVEEGSIANLFNGQRVVTPDSLISGLTDKFIGTENDFFNKLNDVLGSRWPADLLCCFTKFIININAKTLYAIKTILGFLKFGMNLDFNDLKNSLKDLFNNFMRGLIMNQLMSIVHQIIHRIVDPLKKWINNSDKGKLNKLFECLPIKQLLNYYISEAIRNAENFFSELLMEIYKDIEMQKIYKDAKIFQAKENKWINKALQIIDTIIAVVELAATCSVNNTPQSNDVQKLIDTYLGSEDSDYTYPTDESPNIYNSFISQEQQASIEASIAAGDTAAAQRVTTQITQEEQVAISRRLDDCRKNVTIDDMLDPVEWFEVLAQQSRGESK